MLVTCNNFTCFDCSSFTPDSQRFSVTIENDVGMRGDILVSWLGGELQVVLFCTKMCTEEHVI